MADKITWKAGDKVKLVVGGPAMVVQFQRTKADTIPGVRHAVAGDELVSCCWFDDQKHLQQGEFVPASLESVT